MAELHVGKGHAFSLDGFLVNDSLGTYTSRLNLQSVRVSTNGEVDQIVGQSGEIESVMFTGDFLEASFEVIPEGATLANAYLGCAIPQRGTRFTATGFGTKPDGTITLVPIGPFLNSGVNSSGTSVTDTQPWVFISGELNAGVNGKWTASWTMRRYPNVTVSAITAIS